MSQAKSFQTLIDILNDLGLVAGSLQSSPRVKGFPFVLHVPKGGSLVLDLPEPACLRSFDDAEVGFAIVDQSGFTAARWGAAARFDEFEPLSCLKDGPLRRLFSEALTLGQSKSLYGRWRIFAVRVSEGPTLGVHILIADAGAEAAATRKAEVTARHVDVLKRVGKALTMNQTLQPLAMNAVHTISAALELAAVLLWIRSSDEGPLTLTASVGTNRVGTTMLSELHLDDGITCVAELAAANGEPLLLSRIAESPMTTDLEAKFCYLQPGSLFAIPLMSGPKLIGVLELISRQGDDEFLDSEDLLETIAEHLALALNSAMMFESVERLASFDALTGVANHRTMQEFLARRLAECERTETSLGVVMIDVDHFRSFNEEEGHDAGDQVLKLVAEVLSTSLRSYDLAARYGGEEFTLILPGIGTEPTLQLAERVRKRIESLVYFTARGHARHITASLGCATFPESATDAAGLLKAADTALFLAKRNGRNRTESWQPHLSPESRHAVISLSDVEGWIRDEDRAASEDLLRYAEPFIRHLADQLRLTANQEQILRSALALAPSWRHAESDDDGSYIAELRSAADLRAIVPCLASLEERYDRHGQVLPLLGRSLAAILAQLESGGQEFLDDPGKFDPEIVALVSGFATAA